MKEEKLLLWLKKEQEKDAQELLRQKNKFIKEIKTSDKKEIIKQEEPVKLTLWQRIKKVLMG